MHQKMSLRDAILVAAGGIVREQGAAHMTLDAVSAKAQVSKGGLLYHFPSKEALLLGMIDRLIEYLESLRKAEEDKLPDTPGKGLKAHIRAMALIDTRVSSVLPALLAAGAQDPKLLEPVKAVRAKAAEVFCSRGISKEFAAVVSLAVEGMWIAEVLGTDRRSLKEQQSVANELLRLVEEEELRLSEQGARHKT